MWEQIRANQIRSTILVAGMGILLLLVGYFIGIYFFGNATAGVILGIAIWAIMSLVAFFQGDSILLGLAGARKISRDDHPRLYNVVEEMKIASGLEKMPDIYIIDDPALNAFATGRNPDRASVAITSGLLEKLNRDELQGVIAHEISHVKNRDVLVMALSAVLLGTIVILAWYASRFIFFSGAMRGRRGSSQGGGGAAQLIVLAAGLLLMILAPIMAQLIYFAVSRKREYLADASSALYTRYPEGLASALEKIAASSGQLKSANKATAPMYIINPLSRKERAASDLTSTHPPISERVRILRSMGGGAGFVDYDRAYREVRHKGGIVPHSALAASGAVGLRATTAEESQNEPDKTDRTRETSDMMWRLSNYKMITCDCGDRLKIPPNFKGNKIKCPHCGRINAVR